jgi:hypothetical protein
MALEASVQHLLLGNTPEGNYRAPVPGRDVLTSRPMTTLTAGAFRELLLRDDALVVWILVESIRDFRVAVLAHLTADVFFIGRFLRTSASKRKK